MPTIASLPRTTTSGAGWSRTARGRQISTRCCTRTVYLQQECPARGRKLRSKLHSRWARSTGDPGSSRPASAPRLTVSGRSPDRSRPVTLIHGRFAELLSRCWSALRSGSEIGSGRRWQPQSLVSKPKCATAPPVGAMDDTRLHLQRCGRDVRRPNRCASCSQLTSQTLGPSLVVIADNDPARSAERVVETARGDLLPFRSSTSPAQNLGPAGGRARRQRRPRSCTRTEASGSSWSTMTTPWDTQRSSSASQTRRLRCQVERGCGAIGLRGAHLSRGGGARLKRALAPEGVPLAVDYLASGGVPLDRWSALEDVGFFDEALFFGFEDLDQGLANGGGRVDSVGSRVPVAARCRRLLDGALGVA